MCSCQLIFSEPSLFLVCVWLGRAAGVSYYAQYYGSISRKAIIIGHVLMSYTKCWCIPIHVKPRDLYDMGGEDEEIMASNETYPSQDLEQLFPDDDTENIQLARDVMDDDPST